jgi:hypothetical protein
LFLISNAKKEKEGILIINHLKFVMYERFCDKLKKNKSENSCITHTRDIVENNLSNMGMVRFVSKESVLYGSASC